MMGKLRDKKHNSSALNDARPYNFELEVGKCTTNISTC